MKRITIILTVLFGLSCIMTDARERAKDTLNVEIAISDTLTDEFLDSYEIKKKLVLNDYSMIGIQGGVGLSQVMWNPKYRQDMILMPVNFGVLYTKYGRMFGYMPYFGFQIGLMYAQEGYQFKSDKDDPDRIPNTIQGADKAVYDVVEMPLLSHIHFDMWRMKIIANIGFYAGYRLKIHRFPYGGEFTNPAYAETENAFLETDRRWDYGIKGGLGFGLVFDPIEIHIKAMYKHSLSSLYNPDYASKYYYRYAYPSNIVISAGLHFQLTKRTGKTKSDLKKQAKDLVYGTNPGTDR
ncbi:MAG: PorT family protein [Bacteroidales bacterium]|jgi:hypothetical protein|nr:PorT family protein [Bacteroidales bacterium]